MMNNFMGDMQEQFGDFEVVELDVKNSTDEE